MNLVDELLEVVAQLERAGVEYAVCGGIAVTLHGAVRTTKDLDILIRPNDRERVVELVRPLGYAFAALPMVFDADTPHERHLQRVTKVDAGIHLVLDLISAVGALEFALDDPQELQLRGGNLRTVSLATLRRMKTLAGRPQDIADLERLDELEAE